MSQYQTTGTHAWLKLFALLKAQGVPASEADDLVAAVEVGTVAGAQSEVVELDGMAPASQGVEFEDGRDVAARDQVVDADGSLPDIAPGVLFEDDDLGRWLQRQKQPGTWK
ncbi:hypothetical protein [Streptomyces sp. GD-15H]|uniref:hypothetical protein n=1 Tax=Streptomyces sp. GD-15H TaxID=3129112 RepID=UPI003872DC82